VEIERIRVPWRQRNPTNKKNETSTAMSIGRIGKERGEKLNKKKPNISTCGDNGIPGAQQERRNCELPMRSREENVEKSQEVIKQPDIFIQRAKVESPNACK